MDNLTQVLGYTYHLDIQSWGDYFADYIDLQILANYDGVPVWIYYHNVNGSTYTK